MLKRVEIDLDDEMVQEVIRRFHLADAREAIHLALRTLLEADVTGEQHPDEYDQFSDLSAWEPHKNGETG